MLQYFRKIRKLFQIISVISGNFVSTELFTALRGYPLEHKTYPLSFNEYCRFKGIGTDSSLEQDRAKVRNAFVEYNQASAFPEAVLTPSEMKKLQLLNGYFDTMLLKDIAEHYEIANLPVLRYFVKRIMANLSKPTSILAIYNDLKSEYQSCSLRRRKKRRVNNSNRIVPATCETAVNQNATV